MDIFKYIPPAEAEEQKEGEIHGRPELSTSAVNGCFIYMV